ncbi:MAG TPA: DUF6104 family protein [Actinomycetota bacterium]|nr:DUF6104 family protein [Actinomycetota bacterium]
MAGARPQQEEIARTPRAPIDQTSREINARQTLPEDEKPQAAVPKKNRPGSHPKRDQDKPAFLTSKIELLRERRGDQQVTFADVCDHMNDYMDRNPEDERTIQRLALFLAKAEDADHDHAPPADGGLKEPIES